MNQELEQLVQNAPRQEQGIALYTKGTIALYTAPLVQTTLDQFTGGYSAIEGPGCIARNQYEMDQGWRLQERFDFSGHGNSGPHINYEIVNPLGSVVKPLNHFLGDDHQVMLDKYL